MWVKCEHCGFLHSAEADRARCENARKIGLELNRRVNVRAVPRACDRTRHQQYEADALLFLVMTDEHTDSSIGHQRLLLGRCLQCGMQLQYKFGSVAAMNALKGAAP